MAPHGYYRHVRCAAVWLLAVLPQVVGSAGGVAVLCIGYVQGWGIGRWGLSTATAVESSLRLQGSATSP